MERPPEASIRCCWTPTPWYWAARRCEASGSHTGETMPTEVESPTCATAVQEVRGAPAGPAGCGGDAEGRGDDAEGRGDAAAAAALVGPLKTPAAAALATVIASTATAA